MPNEETEIHGIFHPLGDPTRRAMVEALRAGPVSVSALAAPLKMSLASVVQHVQESGLVRTEKSGRERTCRIDPAGFGAAEQWIADRRSVWERRA